MNACLMSLINDNLDVNIYTGLVTWKVDRPGVRKGRSAGTMRTDGYLSLQLYGQTFTLHRLIWYVAHGRMPHCKVDHINGDRADNRIINLREATNSQNCMNSKIRVHNTSGITGVTWHTKRKEWRAFISIDKKIRHLGSFKIKEDAIVARRNAEKIHYGEFRYRKDLEDV